MTAGARADPVCGRAGLLPAHGKWFCSAECIEKYEARLEEARPGFWRKYRKWIFTLAPVLLAIAGTVWKPLAAFRHDFLYQLRLIWPAVLSGFLIGGLIDRYVPSSYVMRILAHGRASVPNAVLMGWLFSACSHGMLAIAVELFRKGACTASVIAFLLASPWANLPITFLLLGFFGWKALVFVVASTAMALFTGWLYQFLERKKWVECNPLTPAASDLSIPADIARRWRARRFTIASLRQDAKEVLRGARDLGWMVIPWMFLGMGIAAGVTAWAPQETLRKFLNPAPLGILATMGLATVIEICSEGSAPLAFQIYRISGGTGNALAFLMGGVATDYTEISILWGNIGRRVAIFLPLLGLPQIFLLAWLVNLLL